MRNPSEIIINGTALSEILEMHNAWLYCSCGTRANLTDANLRRADLAGANLTRAYLTGADLRLADLRRADLTRANLTGADLTSANLTGADLTRANLTGANLTEADLTGADLTEADLTGAEYEICGVKAKRFNVFKSLYRYSVIPIIDVNGHQYVKMGCKFHSRAEWENNFWNNKSEFPDNGSEKTELRKFALETAFRWLDLIANQIKKERQ